MTRTISLTLLALAALVAAETLPETLPETPAPTPAPVVQPQPEAVPVVEAPKPAAKPKTYRWVEGPLCTIYAIQASSNGDRLTGWPPAALPDAPLKRITDLAEIHQVAKAGAQKAGVEKGMPNRLLPLSVAPELAGQLFYALELEGCFWAEEAGKYGISVTSDDPVEIFWNPDGESWKSLAKTQHSIPLERSSWDANTTAWKHGLGTNIGVATVSLAKETDTITAAMAIPQGRAYIPVRIRAYQRWMPRPAEMAPTHGDVNQDELWCRYAGARFVVNFTTPDESTELRLFRKEKIKTAASSRPTEE